MLQTKMIKNMFFNCMKFFLCSCLIICQSARALDEKPIVILVTSYNNEYWVEKNLSSILSQKYNNYRVMYFDDCSTDATYETALKIIALYNAYDRVALIRNNEFVGCPAGNWYKALHSCKDEEIVIHVDGDDFLPHDMVLNNVNEVYQDSNVWLTYGQYIKYPQGLIGACKPMPQDVIANHLYREHLLKIFPYYYISHLRTYYAWMAKLIKLEDFLYEGSFMNAAPDVALMLPLIEMAGNNHVKFVPAISYCYNTSNPSSEQKTKVQLTTRIYRYICVNLPPYKSLTEPLKIESINKNNNVLTIIFASNSTQKTVDYMLQLKRIITDSKKAIVFYDNPNTIKLLQDFFNKEKNQVSFTNYDKQNFKQKLVESIHQGNSTHVSFFIDPVVKPVKINVSHAMCQLNEASAKVFFLSLYKNNEDSLQNVLLPVVNMDHSIYAMDSLRKSGTMVLPVINSSLWQKDFLSTVLSSIQFDDVETLNTSLNAFCKSHSVLSLINCEHNWSLCLS